jgi:hypothetical protein
VASSIVSIRRIIILFACIFFCTLRQDVLAEIMAKTVRTLGNMGSGPRYNPIEITFLGDIPELDVSGYKFNASKEMPVGLIRQDIGAVMECPISYFSLAHEGKTLDDRKTVAENGVVEPGPAAMKKGTSIQFLLLLNPGCVPGYEMQVKTGDEFVFFQSDDRADWCGLPADKDRQKFDRGDSGVVSEIRVFGGRNFFATARDESFWAPASAVKVASHIVLSIAIENEKGEFVQIECSFLNGEEFCSSFQLRPCDTVGDLERYLRATEKEQLVARNFTFFDGHEGLLASSVTIETCASQILLRLSQADVIVKGMIVKVTSLSWKLEQDTTALRSSSPNRSNGQPISKGMLGEVYGVSGETANVKDCSGDEHHVPVHALIEAGTADKARFNQARKAEETRIKEAQSMQRAETPPPFTSTRTNLSEGTKAALDRFEAEEHEMAVAMSLSEAVAPDTKRTVETPIGFTSTSTNVSEGTKDALRQVDAFKAKEAASEAIAPDTEVAFETPPKFTSTRTNSSEATKAALDRFGAEEYQIALAKSLSEPAAPDTERTVETPKRFASRGTNVSEGTKDPLRQVDAFEAKEPASEAVAPDTERIVETPIGFTSTGTKNSEGTKEALRQVDAFEAREAARKKEVSCFGGCFPNVSFKSELHAHH